MKSVAYNNTKRSRMFASAFIGLALTLVMSAGVAADLDQLASLQVLGIEKSLKNIDLDALETKISKTGALNVFAKLQLKNSIDSLTSEVGQIHNGQSDISLDELRQRFEKFFHSTVALLRKGDPLLADELAMSRDKLWKVLSNPEAETPDSAATKPEALINTGADRD